MIGIARIGVNVEYRGVIEADTHGFELGGQRRREAARERLIAAAPSVAMGGHSVNGAANARPAPLPDPPQPTPAARTTVIWRS